MTIIHVYIIKNINILYIIKHFTHSFILMKFKLKVSRFITTIYIITSLITLIFLLHPKFSIIHLRKYRIPKKYSEYLKNYPGYDLNG